MGRAPLYHGGGLQPSPARGREHPQSTREGRTSCLLDWSSVFSSFSSSPSPRHPPPLLSAEPVLEGRKPPPDSPAHCVQPGAVSQGLLAYQSCELVSRVALVSFFFLTLGHGPLHFGCTQDKTNRGHPRTGVLRNYRKGHENPEGSARGGRNGIR